LKAIIETEGLTKVYLVDGREICAVDNLNLRVFEGDIFGYLGPNGAGKTTTILMLLGLTNPTSGSGRVAEYDIVRESKMIRSIAGYIPEKYGFYEDISAYRNLLYFARLNGIKDDEAKERIKWALEVVELTDRAGSLVGTFSRGMKQRLALANALIKRPKIIFLDEPTAGLDPYATVNFRNLVIKLNKEYGMTIFLSSHMLHEVRQVCNRIGFLNNGKLVAVDTLQGFLNRIGNKIVVEVTNVSNEMIKAIEDIEGVDEIVKSDSEIIIYAKIDVRLKIIDVVEGFGEKILTIKIEQPTLEEVFFKVYGEGK